MNRSFKKSLHNQIAETGSVPLLALSDIRMSYGREHHVVDVLRDVSIEISKGELVAITGPSGSGKTTVMNIMGLLDAPTKGAVRIDGRDVANLTAGEIAALRNRKIGFVFQSFHLLPHLTLEENVALPLIYRGVKRTERTERAAIQLDHVGLKLLAKRRPNALSGGQRQRVAIARALVGDPAFLLADEPTGNLDSRTADDIMRLFADINAERGTTIVIVTHDEGVAARCPRRLAMRDGRLVSDVRRSDGRSHG